MCTHQVPLNDSYFFNIAVAPQPQVDPFLMDPMPHILSPGVQVLYVGESIILRCLS